MARVQQDSCVTVSRRGAHGLASIHGATHFTSVGHTGYTLDYLPVPNIDQYIDVDYVRI